MERREQNEWIEKNPKEEARPAGARCPWCNSGNAQVKNGIFYCNRCSYQCDISTPPEICVIGWTTADDHAYLESHCSTEEIYRAIVNEIKEKGYSFVSIGELIYRENFYMLPDGAQAKNS
jgi:hypothetical protein